MKNKYLFTLLSVMVITVSCEKDDNPYGFRDGPTIPAYYFNFKDSVTVIEVDNNVTSFIVEGSFEEGTHESFITDLDGSPNITLDMTQTTAKAGVHFIKSVYVKGNPELLGMNRDKENNLYLYQTVKLIPKNITSEVQIGYIHTPNVIHAGMGDTLFFSGFYNRRTIIKLVPKKK